MSGENPQAPAVPNADPGSLTVMVTQIDKSPIAGASVKISKGGTVFQDVTDDLGAHVFKALPPGVWKLEVAAAGMGLAPDEEGQKIKVGPAGGDVGVVPGPDSSDVTVVLATPGFAFLEVKVHDDKLVAMKGVPVSVTGVATGNKTTRPDGTVLFGPMPIGGADVLAGPADPHTKPHFGRAISPPDAAVFERASTTKIVVEGMNRTVVQLMEYRLEITKIDANFAPSLETCDITFDIKNLHKRKVVLTIEGENYAGKTIVKRDLNETENADGKVNVIGFTGKIEVGAQKDQFIHPLMGPFKVRLEHEDSKNLGVLKSEKPFKVLYHSLDLHLGKHTPDEAEPPKPASVASPATADQLKYVQFKLNELGFNAGPVDGILSTEMKAAVARFERANYLPGATSPAPETSAINDNLVTMLSGSPRKQELFQTGKTPLTQDCRYYVYDNFTCDRTGSVAIGQTPDFIAEATAATHGAKRPVEAEGRMTRGFVALEVEVKLLNKKKQGVAAPQALGPVPVAWEVSDGPEDDSVILGAPAKTFVKNARQFGNPGGGTGTATLAGATRIDDDGDNAAVAFGGMRPTTSAAYVQAWFPNDAGSKLAPFSVSGYGTDTRGGKTFDQALTPLWNDPTTFPKRRGKAGVYLRMSTKGGDNAKVRVSLAFTGLPNKAQLETDHKEALKKDLVKETGRWTVWRRTRVASYCPQIAPPRHIGEPQFTGIVNDLWKEAYIEVENGGAPLRRLVYTNVVDAAKYTAAIMALPSNAKPNGNLNPAGTGPLTAADLTFRATSLYGGPLPPRAQNPGENALGYVRRMGRGMVAWIDPDSLNTGLPNGPSNAILNLFHIETRKQEPEGYAILDYRTHEPVTGQDWDPALPGPPGPPGAPPPPPGNFKPTANPAARNYVDGHRGWMNADGAVVMSVDNESDINEYVVHECSHARYMLHHETQGLGVSDNPTDHDAAQSRCIMSYDVPPDQFGKRPHYHFCGKCILKLRGWTISALPNRYS